MRKFSRMMVGLDALLVTGLCLALISWALLVERGLSNDAQARFVRALSGATRDRAMLLSAGGAALGLLVLHLLWLDRTLRLRRQAGVIVIPKEDGSLIIAVPAVEDSLERVLKQQSGVRDVRVRVHVPEEPMAPADVVAVASVLDVEGIHVIEERMRQAVRRRFGEILRGRDLRVSVRLRRFVSGEARRSRPDEAERIYRGPEYPVEGL